MQLELERNLACEASAERWSARRSLTFLLFTNALLWVGLIWGVAKIV
jgi:hypothetical protein